MLRHDTIQARANPLYATMVLAWSATEVIRYLYYAFGLVGFTPRPLTWLRYTTFYLLYPIGAGSEAFLIFSTLPKTSPLPVDGKLPWTPEEYVRGALFAIWGPGMCHLVFRVQI
jgi:very-long-chain (3R)-3-hydroxyacyl-CoA dehydratase